MWRGRVVRLKWVARGWMAEESQGIGGIGKGSFIVKLFVRLLVMFMSRGVSERSERSPRSRKANRGRDAKRKTPSLGNGI